MRRTGITFNEASDRLAAVLGGPTRREIVDALYSAPGARGAQGPEGAEGALARLRRAMRSHTFPTAAAPVALRQVVDRLDARTRAEGLHVLQGWDYVAHRFPDDIAPVLLLDYCVRSNAAAAGRAAVAVLLDQYFLAVLSLLAVRAWDEGDPNDNLDRVSGLLRDLQGPHGSGHAFIDDAETLLLLAVAYYHPEEHGYDRILQRIRSLDAAHQLRCALPCAAIMGSHLRWGLRFMYRRDVGLMREDNAVDYPWLLFSLLTLMRAHSGLRDALDHDPARERVVEGLLNSLSADPWAFVQRAPAFLRAFQAEHDELRDLLASARAALLAAFDGQRPDAKRYSPLAFACNFLSNAVVAMVVVALGDAEPHPSLNALLTTEGSDAPAHGSAERLARKLTDYSVASAGRLGGGAPLIVFDPYDAVHCFNAAVRVVTEG